MCQLLVKLNKVEVLLEECLFETIHYCSTAYTYTRQDKFIWFNQAV